MSKLDSNNNLNIKNFTELLINEILNNENLSIDDINNLLNYYNGKYCILVIENYLSLILYKNYNKRILIIIKSLFPSMILSLFSNNYFIMNINPDLSDKLYFNVYYLYIIAN